MRKVWVCRDDNYIYKIGNSKASVIDTMLDEWFDGNDKVYCSKVCTKKLKRLKKCLTIYE